MEISNLGKGLLCAIRKLLPQQVRRAMRLTAILLTVVCVNVSAHSYEQQTVSFSGKDVPLQAVFASFEKQTGFSFFFNYSILNNVKPITITIKNKPFPEALKMILVERQLDYYIVGKTVFVIKEQYSASLPDTGGKKVGNIPLREVKGKVLNEQGESLAGATVLADKGKKATVTDANGAFALKNIQPGTMLTVSYTGYKQTKAIVEQDAEMFIKLTMASNELDQAQVIAYGQTTQRFNTGNSVTIKGEDINREPVSNPLLAIEGRVPGLFVTQSSGVSGGGVTVRVQGQNSIGYGNDPLYVVDGVPYVSQMLVTTTGGTTNILGGSGGPAGSGAGNPLNYINPSDIESISVLKDADATAIYGSRAANGAILIVTKKGKPGQSRTDINLQDGYGRVTRMIGVMNTEQFLAMRHEAKANDNSTISSTDYDINGSWDSTRNTNWQKKLIGGTAEYTNLGAAISGGTLSTQYLVGGAYRRQSTVFPGNFNDQSGGLHFNLNTSSTNEKLKVSLVGSYWVDVNHLPYNDFTSTAIALAPDAPQLYNVDGTINWAPTSTGISTWVNPLSMNNITYNINTYNLISNATVEYQLLRGLYLRGSFGYNKLEVNELQEQPLSAIAPSTRPYVSRMAFYNSSTVNTWIVEPQANYTHVFAKSYFEVLVGATIQQNNNNGYDLVGSGYNSDAVLGDIHSAATVTTNASVISQYKYNALFSRINYKWNDKYLFSLTGRRDGSSRFGSNNQFHDFGSVAGGWIFTQEKVFQSKTDVLSFGKLKASYGTTGNDQIGDYQYLNLYKPTTAAVPYEGATGLTLTGLPNPYLQWELTKKLQGGVDLGFFKDRIMISVDYFRNRSSNELLSYALPIFTGFGSVLENFPATVENSGWEGVLNLKIIKNERFSWSANINTTIPANKLIAFPNLAISTYANKLVIGKPISIVKAYHSAGVNPSTGIYWFYSAKGGYTSTPNSVTDRTSIINMLPDYFGAVENNFRYQGFELDFLFQFVKQIGNNYFLGASDPGYHYANQPLSVLGRWQKSGDLKAIQKFNSTGGLATYVLYAESSTAAYSDASYIRLKNISLNYQFDQRTIRSMHLKNFKIYLQGQDLITFTRFKGFDPENRSITSMPPLKILTLGLLASF